MTDKYKLLAIKSLEKIKRGHIIEGRVNYDENHNERMPPTLERQLRERTHSLGKHPAFPDEDESNFEEKLMSKRFKDVLKTFKRHHGVNEVNIDDFTSNLNNIMTKIIDLEKKHKDKLIKLAIDLVREEFDVNENDVKINAKFTTNITLQRNLNKINIEPTTDIEFDNHDEYVNANKEVYKRRFINALIQGSAKKTNHMFNMIDEELQELEPMLPNLYSKLMSGADYLYMIKDDVAPKVVAGVVNVEFPKNEFEKPIINVEGITLPVIIHEIVKGVMEILSFHGLPEDDKVTKFVLDKADFIAAEPWDMRLGPPIWEKFAESIPSEDFNLKHHVYVELVSLPVDEFNYVFREILMGSNLGKKRVLEMLEVIKDELKDEEFDNAMSMLSDDDYFGPEDLDNLNGEDWF